MKNDELIVLDGTGQSIKDRLKIIVERAAKDITKCANACDAYSKKKPLAKLIRSSVWDPRLLDFAKRFADRRQEFQFELIIEIREGVDKTNVTLGDMSKQFGYPYFCPRCALTTDHRMNDLKALFQEFVSPGQKQLLEVLEKNGGIKGLRENSNLEALIKVEKSVIGSSGQPSVGEHRIGEANLELEILRNDILENPNAAIENNWTVFNRKFEKQIQKLTDVVLQQGDRVVREVRGSAYERILDQVGFSSSRSGLSPC